MDANVSVEADGEMDSSVEADGLELPSPYDERARKMPQLVRSLIVENAEAHNISANCVLRALGVPEIGSYRAMGDTCRSLLLLRMLPSAAGKWESLRYEDSVLDKCACARLRAAVDGASFEKADSVDGATDYQLNLEAEGLAHLIGEEARERLWNLAAEALQRARHPAAGVAALSHGARCDGADRSAAREVAREVTHEGDREVTHNATHQAAHQAAHQATHQAAHQAAHEALSAHEIFVRRYSAHTRPWFPFHKDRSEVGRECPLATPRHLRMRPPPATAPMPCQCSDRL